MHGIYRETGQHGEYNQAHAVWKASTAVSPGDLIYRDTVTGYDLPLSSFTWETNETTTLQAIHDVFRGVSMARRLAAQTTDGGISDGNILTTGEFEFPCAALGSAAPVGALVAPAKQSGDAIENQKVKVTSTLGEAIGVVTEDAAVGATFLKFKIVPVLSVGRGVQAIQ
jgi:hypothetical protein